MFQDGATIQILMHEFVPYFLVIHCSMIVDNAYYEYCFVTFFPQTIRINSFQHFLRSV